MKAILRLAFRGDLSLVFVDACCRLLMPAADACCRQCTRRRTGFSICSLPDSFLSPPMPYFCNPRNWERSCAPRAALRTPWAPTQADTYPVGTQLRHPGGRHRVVGFCPRTASTARRAFPFPYALRCPRSKGRSAWTHGPGPGWDQDGMGGGIGIPHSTRLRFCTWRCSTRMPGGCSSWEAAR